MINSSLKSKNSIPSRLKKPGNLKASTFKQSGQKDSLAGFERDESELQTNTAIKVPNKVNQRN